MSKLPDLEPHPTQTPKQAQKLCDYLMSAEEAIIRQDELPSSFPWSQRFRDRITDPMKLSDKQPLPCKARVAKKAHSPWCPYSKDGTLNCPDKQLADEYGLKNQRRYQVIFSKEIK